MGCIRKEGPCLGLTVFSPTLLGELSGQKPQPLLRFQETGWGHVTPLFYLLSLCSGCLEEVTCPPGGIPGHSLPLQSRPQEPDQVYEGITFEDFLKVGARGERQKDPGHGGTRTP